DPFTNHLEFHTGIDISTPAGNRVVAPAAGTVVRVGIDKGYGRFVEVAHGYGVTTLYGHLQATRVAEGQRIKRGDLVALVGSSGRSTGPHLHYEVHADGKPVNPLDYVLNAFCRLRRQTAGTAAAIFSGNPQRRRGTPSPEPLRALRQSSDLLN